MGSLDFKRDDNDKEKLEIIRRRLARRGMKPDLKWEWEVHGPHSVDFNYQVFIGYAYEEPDQNAECHCSLANKGIYDKCCKAHRRYYCVAIYPWAVYRIEEPSKWGHDAIPENRIPVN